MISPLQDSTSGWQLTTSDRNPNTTAVITTTTMTVTAKFTTALIVAFGIAFFMVASAPGPSMSDPVGLVRIATMVIMWLGAVVHMMAVVYKRVIEVIAYSFALLFLSSLDTGGMDVCEYQLCRHVHCKY